MRPPLEFGALVKSVVKAMENIFLTLIIYQI